MEASARQLEETFLATFNPGTVQAAEAHLQKISEQPGFVSVMMYVLGHPNANPYIQQAGATYFKNFLYRFWEKRGKEEKYFSIPEEEKQVVRANIVDLVCQAPPKIKSILSVGYGRIVSHDFPEKMCEDTVQNIGKHLQSSDTNAVVGALLCFYEIAKKYEFKNAERGRGTYATLIPMTFPYLLNMAKITAPMDTLEKAICFKLILKIFYATIHYELDEVLYNDPQFADWLALCVETLSRTVPELQDHMGKNPAAQAQKWAAQTLYQLFHRYGIPKLATEEHKQFAEHFQRTYACNITEVALGVLLRTERNKLAGRVPKVCINILEAAVNTSKTWAIIKSNLEAVVSQVVFPVLCYSDADQELWEDDQQEFIKEKLDPIAEFQSSEKAAQVLLMEMTGKRKDVLMPILAFCNGILTTYNNSPPEQRDPRQKDGVLHIIGTLATLIEKKLSGSLEQLLVTHVFPEFNSPFGFMRFRCCWILQQFNDIEYSSDDVVVAATDFVLACLRDPDLPVRVMGAVAIQHVTRYEAAMARMRPHLLAVMQELIELTNQAEVDDLADVMQELVERYGTDLGSVAIQIAAQLSQTFVRMIVESQDADDEDISKAMVAMGILRTLSTIIAIFVEKTDILAGVEASVLPAVDVIFAQNQLDFLEDVLDVMVTCTFVRKAVSEQMWAYFPILYKLFSTECFDFFDEMMPMFDNYVSFGTERFLSDPAYMTAVLDMTKRILESEDAGEVSHIKALQLLESVVLHCRGHISNYMPAILEMLFVRLNAEIKTRPLELTLLEVLAECIFYDAGLALHTMEAMQAGSVQTTKFFELWFQNLHAFKRAHDLHVVIAAICEILALPEQQLPAPVANGVPHMVTALLGAFAQLPEAYKRKQQLKELMEAEENDEVEDIDPYESYPDAAELGDDDDYEDAEGDEYLQELARRAGESKPSDDEYEDDDEDEDEDGLDEEDVVVETAIDTMDMYIVARNTFMGGRGRTPESFLALVSSLPAEQQQQLKLVFDTAAQRESAQAVGAQ